MKISVVIPTHNRAALLEALVGTLSPHLDGGDELIVVNDGSSDGTHDLLDRLPVVPVNLSSSGGVGAARNAGARRASGDVIVFFDDDVIPDEGFLRVVRDLFADPEVDVAQGPHHVGFHGAGGFQELVESIIWRADMEYVQVRGGYSATLHSQAFAIRRTVFEQTGGFREDFRGAGGEEFDYAARLLENHRILFRHELASWHRYERIVPRLRTLVRRSRRWSKIIRIRSVHGRAHYMTAFRLLLGGLGLVGIGLGLWCPCWFRLPAACLFVFALLEWRTAWVGLRAGYPIAGICAVALKYVQYMLIAVIVGWSFLI